MNSIDTLVSDLLESVADVTVVTWHKKPGDVIRHDEVPVGIETDKVVLEVPTSADDILDTILEDEGTAVTSRQVLGRLREGNSIGRETSAKSEEKDSTPAQHQQASLVEQSNGALSPAIRHLLGKHNLEASSIDNTGVGSRITCEDVEKRLAKAPATKAKAKTPAAAPAPQAQLSARGEERVPMTRPRKRVARRLLGARNSTTMLTTFNEVNMRLIMDLRKQCGDVSEKRHGIRLGFMSFYVKAVVEALKRHLEVNVSTNGDDVVCHNYFDVSMTVPTPHDLITPVLHDVDLLGMADVERNIRELVVRGHGGKLTVEDLMGGNFAITSGGMFGFLMSTPIINPPQSTIPSMHAVKGRPMVVDDKVEILPMMYLALSYDHRLTDGYESVDFLVTIKESLEDPTCLLLDA